LNNDEKIRGAVIGNAKRFYPFESEIPSNLTPYVSLMPQYLPCVYLGGFENFIPDSTNKVAGSENNNFRYSLFYQFMESQKNENIFLNIEQSQSEFIDKYGIKYLIVLENTNISSKIANKVDKIITDSKSKQKFILLK